MRLVRNYILSCMLGGLFLWLAFRNLHLDEFWAGMSQVNGAGVGLYVALFSFAHILRIFRWGLLVSAIGAVSYRTILSVGAVGYMAIMLLPFRIGEFVRPLLLRREGNMTAASAMATVVVERVVDGILFVGLFFGLLALLPDRDEPIVSTLKLGAFVAGCVFGVALVVLVLSAVWRSQTVAVLERVARPLPKSISEKALSMLNAFLDGLALLPNRGLFLSFVTLTVVYWGILGWGMLVMASAVGIEDLTIIGALTLLTVLTVGIMVPAGPGLTGTFELALQAAFALLALSDRSNALVPVFAILLHVCQFGIQVFIGAVFYFLGGVSSPLPLNGQATDSAE